MSLRHAVLGLLADQARSGYDLMKIFDTSLAQVWSATQSQVYAELGKLAAAQLITVGTEGPRGRKEYAITDAGRAELEHWLTQTTPKRTRRSESLLRVFFLGRLSPEQAHHYLAAEADWAADYREHLLTVEKSVPWGQDDLSVYGRMVLDHGLQFTQLYQDWATGCAAAVSNRPDAVSNRSDAVSNRPEEPTS